MQREGKEACVLIGGTSRASGRLWRGLAGQKKEEKKKEQGEVDFDLQVSDRVAPAYVYIHNLGMLRVEIKKWLA